MSAQCTCKAGANGYCKHVGALLYTILDFSESGLKQIPLNTSCTEKPQQWHKPAQRISNVPVIFKHDYEGSGNRPLSRIEKVAKGIKCSDYQFVTRLIANPLL